MILKRTLQVLLAALAVSAFVAAPAQGATAATKYSVSGTYAHADCTGDICVPGQGNVYDYAGTATCVQNCASGPDSGTLTMRLIGQGQFPPNPCVSKTVDASFTFQPTDPFYPPVPMRGTGSGHNVDFKGFRISGEASVGALPHDPMRGFVTHPPNPCSPSSFTGTLDLVWPANPI